MILLEPLSTLHFCLKTLFKGEKRTSRFCAGHLVAPSSITVAHMSTSAWSEDCILIPGVNTSCALSGPCVSNEPGKYQALTLRSAMSSGLLTNASAAASGGSRVRVDIQGRCSRVRVGARAREQRRLQDHVCREQVAGGPTGIVLRLVLKGRGVL